MYWLIEKVYWIGTGDHRTTIRLKSDKESVVRSKANECKKRALNGNFHFVGDENETILTDGNCQIEWYVVKVLVKIPS